MHHVNWKTAPIYMRNEPHKIEYSIFYTVRSRRGMWGWHSNQQKDSFETIRPLFFYRSIFAGLCRFYRVARPGLLAGPARGTRCNRTWRWHDWHLRVPRLSIFVRAESGDRRSRAAQTEKRLVRRITQRKPISTTISAARTRAMNPISCKFATE